jgi:hypothetical protein
MTTNRFGCLRGAEALRATAAAAALVVPIVAAMPAPAITPRRRKVRRSQAEAALVAWLGGLECTQAEHHHSAKVAHAD